MEKRTYVDRRGSWYSHAEAVAVVDRATGGGLFVLDYMKRGEIYQNGGLWFQRID